MPMPEARGKVRAKMAKPPAYRLQRHWPEPEGTDVVLHRVHSAANQLRLICRRHQNSSSWPNFSTARPQKYADRIVPCLRFHRPSTCKTLEPELIFLPSSNP